MKKVVSFVIIIVCIILCIVKILNHNNSYAGNPYLGRYNCVQDNTDLVLRKNNGCTVIIKDYKEVFYVKGRYCIRDNNIEVFFDDSKVNYYRSLKLKGKFEGSRIKLYNVNKLQNVIYIKE